MSTPTNSNTPHSKTVLKWIVPIVLVVGTFFVSLWFVYRPAPSLLPVSLPDSERYAVYSVVLEEFAARRDVKLLVIQKQTSYCGLPECKAWGTVEERVAHMEKYYSPVSEETVRDYLSKQELPDILDSNFDLPVQYVLLDKAELKKDKRGDYWKSFGNMNFQDTEGLITLTDVGFNADHTEAIVRTDLLFCGLCGEGNLFVLEKSFGSWVVKKKFSQWAS